MKPPHAVWDGVLRRLGAEVSAVALEAWLHPLVPVAEERGLRLLAPTLFHGERVRRSHLDQIRSCLAAEVGEAWPVRIEVAPANGQTFEPDGSEEAAPAGATPQVAPCVSAPAASGAPALAASASNGLPGAAQVARPPTRPGTRPTQHALPYRFANFVVGPENALAREASVALASGRSLDMSPLYLTSDSGNGKSHLAHALSHQARSDGGRRVRHVSAEGFMTQLLSSIRARNTGAFKRRFRGECDLLVIEDVQFMGGKKSTQLELFHTLEHLRSTGASVVFTSDRLPRDIPDLDPRLTSQLASGLVAEIEAPDASLRRNILRAKAAAGGVGLPDACLDRLVDAVRGSVRDLEGVLIQLVTSATLLKRAIDLDLTEQALRKVLPASRIGRAPHLSLGQVVEAVASFYGTTPEALRARSRKRAVLVPRQLAMYLCRRYTDASLQEIGRELGRDHPAVSNAVEVVERAILQRAPLRYRVEELATRLESLALGRPGA